MPSSGLIALNPILDQTEADRPFQADFQKDCGSDDLCESQLEVFAELDLARKGDDYKICNVDVAHLIQILLFRCHM